MFIRSSMIGLLLLAIALCPVQASVLYVDDDAAPGGDGLSWETAFDVLQDALDVAKASGSGVTEIRIAGGTYRPTWRVHEDIPRTETFQLINGVTIAGGYRGCPGGDCAGGDPNERDWSVYETILSGDLNGDDVEEDFPSGPSRDDNAVHVFYHSSALHLDGTAVLEGCTITGGNADDSVGGVAYCGGGMVCWYDDPTIRDCVFRGNYAQQGGALWAQECDLTITRCRISGNRAIYSGGMEIHSCGLQMTDCVLEGNQARYGEAMSVDGSGDVRLTRCSISRNFGATWGGAIRIRGGLMVMTHCTLEENVGEHGAGLLIEDSANVSLRGCIVRRNLATYTWSGSGGGRALRRDPENDQLYGRSKRIVRARRGRLSGA